MAAPRFPDAETVLVQMLDGVGGAYACTIVPEENEWDELLPIIAVKRIGGGTDDGITDRALCAVLVIHRDRHSAFNLAEDVRQMILDAGRTSVNGVLIDSTSEVTGNQEVSDIDLDNRVIDASYYLDFRRPRF
ncbi:hypothetical protein GS982_01315 [Rhodococcus hoagii]|uniref:DUF3168 domain-containing protein n=1 Tax=Rhodococcus hoagii TaxID=43767 RepID=A0A9Q4ZIK8_RHOHA|nr:hypothetical protein [Prescottella equi]NKT77246.1 hypothetical protein [Prescottella equi]NKZ81031.1 hypothetical protein [Prescottella equi]